MDARVTTVLADYQARYERELAEMQAPAHDRTINIDDLLIPVGPLVGQFLNDLIKAQDAKVILELGMSYGYTSIYLGEAARATGGKVITTEMHPGKIAYARAMQEKAGLTPYIEIREGDARETLRAAREQFDFVLLDIWKDIYVECLDLFYPKLAPGAYIAADNMITPPQARADGLVYRNAIKAKPHIDTVLLPIGSGIELSRYTAGLDPQGIAPA